MISYDLTQVPFGRRGTLMTFSVLEKDEKGIHGPAGLYLKNVTGHASCPCTSYSQSVLARMVPLKDGRELEYSLETAADSLTMKTECGDVVFAVSKEDEVVIEGSGMDFRVEMQPGDFGYEVPSKEGEVALLNCSGVNMRMAVAAMKGKLKMEQTWVIGSAKDTRMTVTGDSFRLVLFAANTGWDGTVPHVDVKTCREEAAADFADYLAKCPSCPAALAPQRELAAYIDWSCEVPAKGLLKRPGVLMSKNWMTSVWSWDNCFNAMALSYGHPKEAWDQFMTPFDHQDENGALPDFVNDTHKIYTYCKPPVHGWALRHMMEHMTLTEEQLAEAYDKLTRWTNWWLNFRDLDGDGLCEYYHGNDSGWDNSTLFRDGPAIETPDLAAFLVTQMDMLADLAVKLDKPEEEKEWRTHADAMLRRMEEQLFEDGMPFGRNAFTHQKVEAESLMKYLPIILGERLPASIKDSLISGLKNSGCLTEYGFATEPVSSPAFLEDGYWRGPIWAPTSLILIDGLYRAGEKELSETAAKGFCRLAQKSGFAENYNPISGKGLRDLAYTWTSSAFLVIAHEFIPQE